MSDILRFIDTIARDKEIEKEPLCEAVEEAMAQALSKKYGVDDLEVQLDRQTGNLECNYEVNFEHEGRITAQAVKQAIVSKVREQERDVLYDEFETKIGEIVTGNVQRFEGDAIIVNMGRNMEGILPRTEKVRGEMYNVGDRIRCMVLEVKKAGPRVKVILTRAHKDLVRCLFELEVPEIAEGIIEIRRIEREPGYRTKLAVHSSDDKVDCVGACVGVRGTRIKSIIDELSGERIDIIRWNSEQDGLITNALKPAEISHIQLDEQSRKALVIVDEDQLSLAIGRKGQNVRLASRLTHWEIDIMTRTELEKSIAEEDAADAEAESGDGEGEAQDSATEETQDSATEGEAQDSATEETPTETVTEETGAEDAAGDPAAVEATAAVETPAETETETSDPQDSENSVTTKDTDS